MELIATLSFGIVAGWLAYIATRIHADLGLSANLAVGAGGALLGHASALLAGAQDAVPVAIGYALVLLALLWPLGVSARAGVVR